MRASLEILSIILFDGFNEGEENVILSYLMLMAKFFILKYKLNDYDPSLNIFSVKVKSIYDTE